MRAVRLLAHDAPPCLQDIPAPDLGPGQLRIEVAACGLNFADLLMIKGTYQDCPPLPFTLGLEVAGRVAALGEGVRGLEPGQRVAAFTGQGGLAEQVVCDANRCVPLPADMPFAEAAGFPIAYGTSHLALVHRAGLRAGETLVVLGAAGGVGLTAVEIGAALGARVIAVARGAAKAAVARQAGAELCLDSDTVDLRAELKALGGVDVVYDAVGEPMASAALRALHPEGRFLAIGFAGGKVPQFPANILLVKNLTVIGLYWGGYLGFAPQVLTGSLRDLTELYAQGGIRPHISHTLPLERFDEGLALLRDRRATGKVVVTVAPT